MMIEAKLGHGVIFGDLINKEFVYMPGSELGAAHPVYVYENDGKREDVALDEALRLIRVRSLRPVRHPVLGLSSC